MEGALILILLIFPGLLIYPLIMFLIWLWKAAENGASRIFTGESISERESRIYEENRIKKQEELNKKICPKCGSSGANEGSRVINEYSTLKNYSGSVGDADYDYDVDEFFKDYENYFQCRRCGFEFDKSITTLQVGSERRTRRY